MPLSFSSQWPSRRRHVDSSIYSYYSVLFTLNTAPRAAYKLSFKYTTSSGGLCLLLLLLLAPIVRAEPAR